MSQTPAYQWDEGRGKAGHERGIRSEERFYEALGGERTPRPSWIVDVRWATPSEDQHGVDFVLSIDVGAIAVQVKSSFRGLRRFKSKHPNSKIVVVVVLDRDTPESICAKTVRLITPRRDRMLEARR